MTGTNVLTLVFAFSTLACVIVFAGIVDAINNLTKSQRETTEVLKSLVRAVDSCRPIPPLPPAPMTTSKFWGNA
jgi:hypothetical protein